MTVQRCATFSPGMHGNMAVFTNPTALVRFLSYARKILLTHE